MTNQIIYTRSVVGTVKAQYIQNFLCVTFGASHFKEGTEKRAAKKAAERNAIVMTAMIFIADESRFDASSSFLLASARARFATASSCVKRPEEAGRSVIAHGQHIGGFYHRGLMLRPFSEVLDTRLARIDLTLQR
jgi:hypothetical protein